MRFRFAESLKRRRGVQYKIDSSWPAGDILKAVFGWQ